nr:tetratricopeptide repeat protein [Lachnospiraceae bacterium]
MNIDEIFAEIDRLYTANEGAKVEEYILEKLSEAAKLGDEGVMIQLLNELIGHYRETSEFDKMTTFAEKLLNILEGSSVKGTMAHATSLLNVANAYRAAGMLRESNALYQEVKSYYDANVAPDSMLYASLLNNMSLLFQEMGDYESSADCLERALGISLLHDECRIEQATTYANLAMTLIKLDRLDEAEGYLAKSSELFEEDEEPDYHYSAALTALAEIRYVR